MTGSWPSVQSFAIYIESARGCIRTERQRTWPSSLHLSHVLTGGLAPFMSSMTAYGGAKQSLHAARTKYQLQTCACCGRAGVPGYMVRKYLTCGSEATFRPRPGGCARHANLPPAPPTGPRYSITSFGHTRAICPKWPQFYEHGVCVFKEGDAYARSIFDWSLVSVGLGIRFGRGISRRRNRR